jgi:hypothetical protein
VALVTPLERELAGVEVAPPLAEVVDPLAVGEQGPAQPVGRR